MPGPVMSAVWLSYHLVKVMSSRTDGTHPGQVLLFETLQTNWFTNTSVKLPIPLAPIPSPPPSWIQGKGGGMALSHGGFPCGLNYLPTIEDDTQGDRNWSSLGRQKEKHGLLVIIHIL